MRSGNAGDEAMQFFCHHRTAARAERADGAEKVGAFRNDIIGRPRLDLGNRDYSRIEHRYLARNHRLYG